MEQYSLTKVVYIKPHLQQQQLVDKTCPKLLSSPCTFSSKAFLPLRKSQCNAWSDSWSTPRCISSYESSDVFSFIIIDCIKNTFDKTCHTIPISFLPKVEVFQRKCIVAKLSFSTVCFIFMWIFRWFFPESITAMATHLTKPVQGVWANFSIINHYGQIYHKQDDHVYCKQTV